MVREIDVFLRKALLLALIASCSIAFLRLGIGESKAHLSAVYPDFPIALCIGLLAALSGLFDSGSRGVRRVILPFLPLFLLFVWWMVSGLLHAKRFDFLLSCLLQYFGCIVLVLSLPSFVSRHGLSVFALDSLLKFGILVSLVGILQGMVKPSRMFEDINSTLSANHAHIGLYMLVVLTAAFFRSNQRKDWLPMTAAFMAFTAIIISGSRAAQLGCLPILMAYFLRRISFLNLVKIGVVIAVIAGSLQFIMERRQANNQKDTTFEIQEGVKVDQSAGRRLLMWIASWKVINSSPERFLWGIGYTNYRWEYGRLIVLPFYTNAAHNIYLHLWTETGLVGMLIFLLMYLVLWIEAMLARRTVPEAGYIAALVIGMFLSGLTQETLYPNEAFANFATYFFFSICLLFTMTRQLAEERMERGGRPDSGGSGPAPAPAPAGWLPGRIPATALFALFVLFQAEAPRAGEVRAAMNLALSGPMRTDSADPLTARKRAQVDYFAKLGFTHLIYSMGAPEGHGDPAVLFRKEPGRGWTYNGGRYSEGPMAESFAAMKAAAESRGMTLIPYIETFTHVHHLIALDPAMSEFGDWESSCRSGGFNCSPFNNHVAAIGGNPGESSNPAAAEFFREYLRIIRANWGKPGSPGPEYIHIGHDEMGTLLLGPDGLPRGASCFVKAERSASRPESKAELVALEVTARSGQVDSILGKSTRIMIFGDSFLPGDNGELFGLAGNLETGEGGALLLLRDRHGLGGRLVVVPWAYSVADGEPFLNTRAVIDKRKQLAYLDRLGFDYVVGTGEDGGAPEYHPLVGPTQKALFEWLVAADLHPGHRRGYAHLTFDDPSRCHPKFGVCVDYSAPMLAYLAWHRPASFTPFKGGKYSKDVFAKVDFARSIREKDWRPAVHYSYPEAKAPWWKFW